MTQKDNELVGNLQVHTKLLLIQQLKKTDSYSCTLFRNLSGIAFGEVIF